MMTAARCLGSLNHNAIVLGVCSCGVCSSFSRQTPPPPPMVTTEESIDVNVTVSTIPEAAVTVLVVKDVDSSVADTASHNTIVVIIVYNL